MSNSNNYIAREHYKGQQGRARASRHNITPIHIEKNIDLKAAHEEGSRNDWKKSSWDLNGKGMEKC